MNAVSCRQPFPNVIQTQRLQLYRPHAQERSLYARQFAEAYSTRPQEISPEFADSFAGFMIEHWNRYAFGFFVLRATNASGAPSTIGHAGFKYVDAWPGHWAQTRDAITDMRLFPVPVATDT